MNRIQKIAFENPTLLGMEAMHPRFTHIYDWGHVRVTVNSGYE